MRTDLCRKGDLAVATTKILPNIGSPVSSPAFDEAAAEAMSIGEAAYAATFFLKIYAQKLADPAAANEIAQFLHASGADWSGFDPATGTSDEASTEDHPTPADEHTAASAAEESDAADQPSRRVPVPPDNYYDSLPGLAHMLRQQQAAMDAALTHFAGHVEAVIDDQQTMLGAPEGIKIGRASCRERV